MADDSDSGPGWKSGCLVLVILVVVVGKCSDCQNDTKKEEVARASAAAEQQRQQQLAQQQAAERVLVAEKAKAQDDLQSKLMVFGRESAPDLFEAIQKLTEAESVYAARIDQLEKTLVDLRRDPTKDNELRQWKEALDAIRKKKVSVQRTLEDAYLLKKKYELSPSPEQEKEIKATTSKAALDANSTLQKYSRLLQQGR